MRSLLKLNIELLGTINYRGKVKGERGKGERK
jgi:hypothetical protein